jgi:hypothetical protein
MSTYFEFQERRSQGSVAFKPDDIIEWPEITVTEGEIDEDTLLLLSLQSDVSADEKERKAHIDRVNKIKDRVDEAADAKRVHIGMTLDEFLTGK